MGDISCRSALTVHRGTTHASPIARPVPVLGVDAPGAKTLHHVIVTKDYRASLPQSVRDGLICRIVDELEPITQKHDVKRLLWDDGGFVA
jgi:hypothetical protein